MIDWRPGVRHQVLELMVMFEFVIFLGVGMKSVVVLFMFLVIASVNFFGSIASAQTVRQVQWNHFRTFGSPNVAIRGSIKDECLENCTKVSERQKLRITNSFISRCESRGGLAKVINQFTTIRDRYVDSSIYGECRGHSFPDIMQLPITDASDGSQGAWLEMSDQIFSRESAQVVRMSKNLRIQALDYSGVSEIADAQVSLLKSACERKSGVVTQVMSRPWGWPTSILGRRVPYKNIDVIVYCSGSTL